MSNIMRRVIVAAWLLGCAGCAGPALQAPATGVPRATTSQTIPRAGATGATPATPPALATSALELSPLATPVLGQGDVVWRLAQWQDARGAAVTVAEPQRYRVQFQAGRAAVSVSTDCQGGTGSYTTAGLNVTVTLAAMTGAMCAPDSPAPAFIAAVGAASTYGLTGADLTLHSNSGDTLRFTP